MFGPYEITLEGRVLHGNVVLKEFHIVERDGNYFVLRVADMAVAPIAPALARLLEQWTPSPGTLVPDKLMQALRAADLVAEEASQEPKSLPEAATTKDVEGKIERPDPVSVSFIALFLAQTCNLACTYCYGQAGTYGGSGLMSAETARKAVDWLMENSGGIKQVRVAFFGGEPLLNLPVLWETVSYAKEQAARHSKEVSFGMTTNATLLDDEIVAYLKQERSRRW
jgi:uncharacterized protein